MRPLAPDDLSPGWSHRCERRCPRSGSTGACRVGSTRSIFRSPRSRPPPIARGGTVNDAYLAGIVGAAHRYHERSGAKLTNLRVTMPVNLRRDEDPLGNNRFTPVRFTLPADEADPATRIRRVAELAHRQRAEPGLAHTDTVAGLLNRLPERATRAVLGSMLKSIDFVATNVAGFDHPVFLAGARVTRSYAFAPTSGSALSVTLLSHLDSCHIGVNADTAAIDQPSLLTTCLVESFDEILALRPAPGRTRTAHSIGGTRS